MKIVVIGGTGLIGSKLVQKLRDLGHEVTAASPSKGVNTITGEGLTEALKGTNVVVDVANSPSFEDKAVLEFFETSGRNLKAAEEAAGVGHHIALSVVGSEVGSESGYLRAKAAQEKIINSFQVPYTIVRATQFFEFLEGIAQAGTVGQTVRLSPALFQPMASDDVVDALLKIVLERPVNGIIEIAGPDQVSLSGLVEQYLKAKKDSRTVIPDEKATYFGAKLNNSTLVPSKNARLGSTNFKSWWEKNNRK